MKSLSKRFSKTRVEEEPLGPKSGKAVLGLVAKKQKGELVPVKINRRALGPNDVSIEIKYCGLCHSDVSQVNGEWGPQDLFPMCPGHEIVGVVDSIGASVTKFKVGQRVGVGCMVDSCRSCEPCNLGEEQYCTSGCITTYNGVHNFLEAEKGLTTYGGYSSGIVVDEAFVVDIPESLDLASAAPLLCAGITVFSPMKKYNLEPGQKLAVAGMGGLGHLAVKFGKALGAHVTVLSRSDSKKETSLNLGADDYLNTSDATALAAAAMKFDMVLDTIGAQHEIAPFMNLLKLDGTLVMVGLPPSLAISPFALILPRRKIGGSLFGGIKETQEMLDLAAEKNVVADIDMISATTKELTQAFKRTLAGDVKYRFVIDMSTLKN